MLGQRGVLGSGYLIAYHVNTCLSLNLCADDITILTLEKPVKFNQFISPACLWSGNTELRKIVGASGVVSSYNFFIKRYDK